MLMSATATWSCPSETLRVTETPARSCASASVRERLELVRGRREDATAAWEAWKHKKGSPPIERRAATAPQAGRQLDGQQLEEWCRAKDEIRRSALRRRTREDRELRAKARHLDAERLDRVEARRAAAAAAARLRRLSEDANTTKSKLRVMSRQLAQLSQLDESPLLARSRHKLPKIRDNESQLLRLRRDEYRGMRMRPTDLVAAFRRKRRAYLGSRVSSTSDTLLGQRRDATAQYEPETRLARGSPPAAKLDEDGVVLEEDALPPAPAPNLIDVEDYDHDEYEDDHEAPDSPRGVPRPSVEQPNIPAPGNLRPEEAASPPAASSPAALQPAAEPTPDETVSLDDQADYDEDFDDRPLPADNDEEDEAGLWSDDEVNQPMGTGVSSRDIFGDDDDEGDGGQSLAEVDDCFPESAVCSTPQK